MCFGKRCSLIANARNAPTGVPGGDQTHTLDRLSRRRESGVGWGCSLERECHEGGDLTGCHELYIFIANAAISGQLIYHIEPMRMACGAWLVAPFVGG